MNPGLLIEVDGGIDKTNVKEVIEAGANVIVAGSAVFNGGEIDENIKALRGNNLNVAIVSGGNPPSEKLLKKYISEVEFIIAADKGSECLYKYNIIPDLLLGDFDSAKKEILDNMKLKVKEVLEFQPEKDYTDTEIAVMEAIKRGAEKIYLFGATGTRMDHTLGNIGLMLTTKKKGANLEILDDNNRLYLGEIK